jgi:hypothetical protein
MIKAGVYNDVWKKLGQINIWKSAATTYFWEII